MEAGEGHGDPLEPFARLLRVVAALRSPEGGCPWDREQTVDSVRRYLLEEVHELLEALETIERDGPAAAREELGDLLFQVAFLARLFEERGAFGLGDVASCAAEKMVRRHPHVFGEGDRRREDLRSSGDVLRNWSDLKAEARGEKAGTRSVLDGVARTLPALERALELTDRAARVGFDWPDAAAVLAKVDEELLELREAIVSADRGRVDEELGDLLFAITNLGRKLGRSPELALQAAIGKFLRRFHRIEERLRESGRGPKDATLEELDRLWEEAKGDGL